MYLVRVCKAGYDMADGKIDRAALLGWTAFGLAILTFAPIGEPLRKLGRVLVDSPTASRPTDSQLGEFRAASATSPLDGNLKPRAAYGGPAPQVQKYSPDVPAQMPSYSGPGGGIGTAHSTGGVMSDVAPIGARKSIEEAYGAEAASRRYLGGLLSQPQVGSSSPVILNPAGPRTYSDGNGGVYTQAGPHGVVNTGTGEFSPVN